MVWFVTFIFKTCTADVLDLARISAIVNDENYLWRLVSYMNLSSEGVT